MFYQFLCADGHETLYRKNGVKIGKPLGLPKRIECEVCGKPSRRNPVPSGVNVNDGFKPYLSEHIHPKGKPVWITSQRHKRELLDRYGLVEKHDYFR